MNQEQKFKSNDEQAAEAQTASPLPPQAGAIPQKGQAPDRLQQFLRRMSIWLGIIVVVFFAGALADHYLRYKPLSEAFTESRSTLDQANQTIGDLQAEKESLEASLSELNDRLKTFENENKALQEKLAMAETHLGLLRLLEDVMNARLALAKEDIEGAQTALVDTPQRLDDLLPRLKAVNSRMAESLPQRLELILSGLERKNLETVEVDLELFSKDLLTIETTSFSE